MKILITTAQVPFVFGGAEIHALELKKALLASGHEAEIVQIPFKWYPPEKILDHLMACRLLDLTECNGERIDRVIGLKFPAYHIPHPNKVMWVLHQHRPVFDLWGTPGADPAFYPEGSDIRHAVTHLEKQLFHEARKVFANSRNVADRLDRFTGIQAPPLYHPPQNADRFFVRDAEDFLYYPSRVCPLKRQDLVLRALAHTREPVKVRFAGKPDNPSYLEKMKSLAKSLRVHKRVSWLGRISDEDMLEQYARCRAVVFPPEDEDYGYITLEGMLSSKPVITCTDSGGPLEFVRNGHTGLVADGTPESLAAAMDQLWKDRSFAVAAGKEGRRDIDRLQINWTAVVEKLLHED